jgi:hypothetical protein
MERERERDGNKKSLLWTQTVVHTKNNTKAKGLVYEKKPNRNRKSKRERYIET